MKTFVTVLGARPQFIKAAMVSRAFKALGGTREILIHTGQHFDPGMSDIFFQELGIPEPNYHLGISGGGHGAMTGAMLQALEPLLQRERPDWVLVYGDTNSTLAGAIAAAKLHIPIAHIEAGLRSHNRRMPEEQNRIVADHLAEALFTPTDLASENLYREGILKDRINQVGDVMYDAAVFYAGRAGSYSGILDLYKLSPKAYILATIHRAENTDDGNRLCSIMKGLDSLASHMPVILPLHPRTRAAIERERLRLRNIHLIDPVGYLDMVCLEANATVIATDSGGVQKEAYFQSVPCVTLRDETEWVELVELGWNRLAPPGSVNIKEAVLSAIGTRGRNVSPYGDGNASEKIALRLLHTENL